MGHLASEFPDPYTTCTYYRPLDHMTKYCPQLIAKWKTRGNQNQDSNQNVQKISVETWDKGPRITFFTCRGARIGDNTMHGGRNIKQWGKKSTGPM
jgi:hypothetical protein